MDLNFGERLRVWRSRAGLSSRQAAAELRNVLPRAYWISHEKLRRMEVGEIDEHDVNPVVLSGLAGVYSCKLADLSPTASEDAKSLSDLLMSVLHCSMRSSPNSALAVA